MANNSRLTPAVAAKIVKHVRNGTPQKYAALAAGIPESTFKKWVNRGIRETRGVYRNLWTALKDARGAFVASNVAVIRRAANGVTEVTVKESTILDRLGRPVVVCDADGKAILDANGNPIIATRKETTRRKVFEWTAAAWLLERRAQEEFAANRTELKELKAQLALVTARLEALSNGQRQGDDSASSTGPQEQPPAVGGDARPDSI